MRRLGIVTVVAALLLPAGAESAGAVQRLIDVRQVPTDTLRDVALATFEHGRPVIYYNPGLLQQVGPQLTSFFLTHEYGHVRYGHTGAALAAGDGDASLARQRQELDADCYATRALAESDPEAVTAALRFFTRMGPFRYDAWHPSGSQRAAKILACLPTNASDDATPGRSATAQSESIASRGGPAT